MFRRKRGGWYRLGVCYRDVNLNLEGEVGLEEELGKDSVGGTKQSRADGAGLKPQGASKAPLPLF